MQPTKSPGVDVTRPNTATMGDFEDRPALDMLPDESFSGAGDDHALSLLRRRNIVLMGVAALLFWAVVIALLIVIF